MTEEYINLSKIVEILQRILDAEVDPEIPMDEPMTMRKLLSLDYVKIQKAIERGENIPGITPIIDLEE